MNNYKPSGYNSASPYFVIDGALKFVDLMVKLFDAKVLRRYESDKGKIVHMELRIDDTVIMLADSNENFGPIKQLIHVYVPDVESVFGKAEKLGCEILDRPKERTGDPDKRGSFRDSFGNLWSVATQVEGK